MGKSAEQGLLGRLKGLFGNEPKKPAPPPLPAKAKSVSFSQDEDILLGLRDFLSEGRGAFDRSLHLISLVEFREAVGEKWERLSPKVVLIANAVITRHLGDAGSFRLHGEDCFVIVFRGLTAEQERARAIAAANDLGQRLLGAQFASGEQPLALAA